MPRPRKDLVSIEDTPYYHLTSRCVRRAMLCGVDQESGTNYEYRKQWIEERIRLLASVFAIDLGGYAVMSNHYHIVAKLSPEQVDNWDDDEVIERWRHLYKGPRIIRRKLAGKYLSPSETNTFREIILEWRKRLVSLSWFMKCLNEPIARRANKEDGCKGHFWESRFTSHALLTEEALLSCLAYVDLNPIRAGQASKPEESKHTSIRERLFPEFNLNEAIKRQCGCEGLKTFTVKLKPLLAFDSNLYIAGGHALPFDLSEYIQLIDWLGRAVPNHKRGSIPKEAPNILDRLGIELDKWVGSAMAFERNYHGVARDHLKISA